VWLLKHVDDPEPLIREALIRAKEWYWGNPPNFDGRGHFVLRNYDGHWALERFLSSQTMPFSLSNAMAFVANEAVQWFFDPSKMLPDPEPHRRQIGWDEIIERIAGYQYFIDKETRRQWQNLEALPPLCKLPFEQQHRLVHTWDQIWWGWLDRHPAWRWTPALGFYRADEKVYPLI
jgi:hypothetical protein